MLESDSILLGKNLILTPMREGGCLRMNGEAWPEPAGGAGAKFKALAN
jgi:hypothetical protein